MVTAARAAYAVQRAFGSDMDPPTAQTRMRRLDIFGHLFFVAREGGGWGLYYPGGEGKRGPRLEILVSNIVCLAIRLVTAGRLCPLPF